MAIRARSIALLLILLLAGCAHQGHSQSGYGDHHYSDGELDQMLAPIALYPDVVLSQVLMAATYPLDVEEAADWSAANPHLSGSTAVDAVAGYNWDPSVQALVAYPDLLARLADDPGWTWRLGDAYLAQEGDVLDSIQRLRDHAYRARHLDSLDHLHVYRDSGIIIIEPAHYDVVYLPYYHPHRVYGDWWWPDYPPYFWDSHSRFHSGVYFHWSDGYRLGSGFFFSGFHWSNRHIVTFDRHHFRDRGRHYRHYKNPRRWHHRDRDRRHRDFRDFGNVRGYTDPRNRDHDRWREHDRRGDHDNRRREDHDRNAHRVRAERGEVFRRHDRDQWDHRRGDSNRFRDRDDRRRHDNGDRHRGRGEEHRGGRDHVRGNDRFRGDRGRGHDVDRGRNRDHERGRRHTGRDQRPDRHASADHRGRPEREHRGRRSGEVRAGGNERGRGGWQQHSRGHHRGDAGGHRGGDHRRSGGGFNPR